ncbi:histidine phosphatase family protein [Paenibacillus marinisediminis]
MPRIGLIRHGCTIWNTERRAQGQTDIPLNELGVMQAEALGVRLLSEKWDYIYSSDLIRASETAKIIGRIIKKDVRTDIRLREMYKGEIEGTTLQERVDRWGSDWENHQNTLGIESEQSIIYRGISFISEITEHLNGASILVVSHGALIETILKELLPQTEFKGPLGNTSITIITNRDTNWNCELFNCAKHLEGKVNEDGFF